MKTIFENTIFSIAPNLLRKKTELKEILIVIETLFQKHIIEEIKCLVALDRIDLLDEKYVDLLAEELHVDFYDYGISIEEKRELVKTSLLTHMKKGTPEAVNSILDIFFKGAKIREWFEYGGDPGWFQVDISDVTITKDIGVALKLVESTKRKSQHLKELVKNGKVKCELKYHSGTYMHKDMKIRGDWT